VVLVGGWARELRCSVFSFSAVWGGGVGKGGKGAPPATPDAADPLAGKEATAARRCLAVLQQAAASPSFLPPPPGARGGGSSAGTHQQQLNLVDTLAALRCVGVRE
jgi:hypothetical protein